MSIGWPHEGMRTRLMRPEAALLRRVAADRAMDALRHDGGCRCVACRSRRQLFRRLLVEAVAA